MEDHVEYTPPPEIKDFSPDQAYNFLLEEVVVGASSEYGATNMEQSKYTFDLGATRRQVAEWIIKDSMDTSIMTLNRAKVDFMPVVADLKILVGKARQSEDFVTEGGENQEAFATSRAILFIDNLIGGKDFEINTREGIKPVDFSIKSTKRAIEIRNGTEKRQAALDRKTQSRQVASAGGD